MGYIKLNSVKDNTIQDRAANSVSSPEGTSANMGADSVVEISNRKLSSIVDESFVRRALIQFELSGLTKAVADGKLVLGNSDTNITLHMRHMNHETMQATNFNINVFPVLSAWTEGGGLFNGSEGPEPVSGVSNWNYRVAGGAWNDPGLGLSGALTSSDVDVTSSAVSNSFTTGYEDLTADIKSIVTNWVEGTSSNHGLLLTLDQTNESLTGTDFGAKAFASRETNTLKAPYISISYNNLVKDDRASIAKGASAGLAFYNIVNNEYQDITSSGFGTSTANFLGTVKLYGSSSSTGPWAALTGNEAGSSLTAVRVKKGVYRTTFTLGMGEYKEKESAYGTAQYGENFFDDTEINEYEYFQDVWTVTGNHPLTALSTSSVSSTWKAIDWLGSSSFYDLDQLSINIRNFKDSFHHESHAIFRLFIEKNNLIDLTPLTAAVNSSTTGVIVRNGQWKIVDAETNETIIPYFDLDYDQNGNFFELDMSNLEVNYRYKIVFKLTHLGETKILNNKRFTFSVI